MSLLNTILIFLAAFLAVFWEAAFNPVRHLLGAQIDLLPPIMVYASLTASLSAISLLALCGGLWFDSLSANPLGISVAPLYIVGLLVFMQRDLILRDQTFAQLVLGFGASAAAPLMTLLLLLTKGHAPLFGWGTVWQLIVMAVGGAVATLVFFEAFGWLNRNLGTPPVTESSFRLDREIRRGR